MYKEINKCGGGNYMEHKTTFERVFKAGSISQNFHTGRQSETASEIGIKASKKGKCTKCGKNCSHTEKFTEYLMSDAGQASLARFSTQPQEKRTPESIREKCKEQAEKWAEKPLVCKACREAR